MTRSRLDLLLAERGLFESRSRAAAAIAAGHVRVGGRSAAPAVKAGQLVPEDAEVSVEGDEGWASRGALKLVNALSAFGVDVAGRRCLDVGASTGGFTDVLLRCGAAHVVALDVATGEVHPRLRADPRVTVVEGVNARALDCAVLPYLPELVVVDVSFISVRKVLPAVLACSAAEFDCLALVKPQFELGPDRVGKGGVVRSAGDRRAALVAVTSWAHDAGFALLGVCSSGLPGPAGNRESFVWLGPGGRAGAVEDVERAVLEVEP